MIGRTETRLACIDQDCWMSLNEWSCGTVSEKQPPYAGFIDLEYGCRSGHLHCMRLKTGQDESALGVLHTSYA